MKLESLVIADQNVLAAAGTENVHSMPDSGNHPTVRYILHKKTGEWQVNPPKMVEN